MGARSAPCRAKEHSRVAPAGGSESSGLSTDEHICAEPVRGTEPFIVGRRQGGVVRCAEATSEGPNPLGLHDATRATMCRRRASLTTLTATSTCCGSLPARDARPRAQRGRPRGVVVLDRTHPGDAGLPRRPLAARIDSGGEPRGPRAPRPRPRGAVRLHLHGPRRVGPRRDRLRLHLSRQRWHRRGRRQLVGACHSRRLRCRASGACLPLARRRVAVRANLVRRAGVDARGIRDAGVTRCPGRPPDRALHRAGVTRTRRRGGTPGTTPPRGPVTR